MTSAIAYLRISRDPHDQRLGVTRQREDVKRLAEQLGADLSDDHIFADNDVSGSKLRREQTDWWKVLGHIRVEHPTYLLAFKADRLGRRLADLEGLDELCKETGTRVWTATEGDLFSNSAWPFIAAQAKVEAENTRIRVTRMQQSRRNKGLDGGGGHRPYGYEADRRTVVPAEAEIIRELARRTIAGESTQALCRELNERGIRPPRSNSWKVNVVRTMLANARYAGRLIHKGEDIGEAAWPPILDQKTYQAVLARLEATEKPRGGRPSVSLLGGIVRCGRCETPLYANKVGGGQGPVYRCSNQRNGCNVQRKRELIDTYVSQRVLASVDKELLIQERAAMQSLIDEIEQRIIEIDLELYEVEVAYKAGEIDKLARLLNGQRYFDYRDELHRNQRRLQARWGQQVARLGELSHEHAAEERWGTWTVDQKRAFIHGRVEAVLVFPTRKRGPAARNIDEDEVVILPRIMSQVPTTPMVTSAEGTHPGATGLVGPARLTCRSV